MKKIKFHFTSILVPTMLMIFVLSGCCVLKQEKLEMAFIENTNTGNEISIEAKDYKKLYNYLSDKVNYNQPIKKNMFLEDYIVRTKKNKISLSTYNLKFKIDDGKIGQYDQYALEVKKIIDKYTIKVSEKKINNIYRVGLRTGENKDSNVYGYSIINKKDKDIKIDKQDKDFITNLLINNQSGFYNQDNSSGTASMFIPNFAFDLSQNDVIILSLSSLKVMLIDESGNKEIKAINGSSEEFKNLKSVINKYYPNLKY